MGKIKDAFKSAENAIMSNDTVSELVDDWKTGAKEIVDTVKNSEFADDWKTGVDMIHESADNFAERFRSDDSSEREVVDKSDQFRSCESFSDFVRRQTGESELESNGGAVTENMSSAVANFGEAAVAAIDDGANIDVKGHAATTSHDTSRHVISMSNVDKVMNDKIFFDTMSTGALAAKLAQKDGMSAADAYDVGNAVSAYTAQLSMFETTCKGIELSEATRNLADRVSRQYGVDVNVIKDSFAESSKLLSETPVPVEDTPYGTDDASLTVQSVKDTWDFMRNNSDLVKADSITISEMGYYNAADVTSQVISQITGYEPDAADADYAADVAD